MVQVRDGAVGARRGRPASAMGSARHARDRRRADAGAAADASRMRRPGRCTRRRAMRAAARAGARSPSACRRCATIRNARARIFAALLDEHDPGLHARAELRSRRGRRRTLYRARRASARSRCCASRASTARPRWPRCSRAPGFDAYDVHMTDILSAARAPRATSRPGRLRRVLLRRRARRRRGLGASPSCSMRWRATSSPRSSRAPGDLHAGRLQRLPDAGGAQGPDPRRGRLAALRAQPLRAVRGAAVLVRVPQSQSRAVRRHARIRAAGRRRARRGPGGVRRRRRRRGAGRARRGHAAVRRSSRCAHASAIPYNPNGSPLGIAGICSADGRVTAVMPHPERVFRTVQNSWAPREWGEDGGWMRLFRNARALRRLGGAASSRARRRRRA